MNGQNYQGIELIEEYGEHDFFPDYIYWLETESGLSPTGIYNRLKSVVRIYHPIRGCS
jgi:hypothetical protein